METYKLEVTEVYFSNEPIRVSLGFGGEGGCHTPVEEMKEISDINMVLLKGMLFLLLLVLLLLTPPVVLLQNLVLVLIVLHTVVIHFVVMTCNDIFGRQWVSFLLTIRW
jgi:hypothetical protein